MAKATRIQNVFANGIDAAAVITQKTKAEKFAGDSKLLSMIEAHIARLSELQVEEISREQLELEFEMLFTSFQTITHALEAEKAFNSTLLTSYGNILGKTANLVRVA